MQRVQKPIALSIYMGGIGLARVHFVPYSVAQH